MTKEQIFLEIDEIYSEWHGGYLHIGQERENRIKQAIEKAINYTRCCTELKDENTPKYGTKEWMEMARDIFIKA
jgi:hypothetical protein